MDVKFNVNYQVKVKLTNAGIEELKRQHDELNKVFPAAKLPFTLSVDDEGYTEFQMWDLMSRLGGKMSFAFQLPFETNIIITQCEEIKSANGY